MRILFALPGLHRVYRGAEIAFIAIARALADNGDQVTLIGSGHDEPDTPYGFLHADSVSREKCEWLPSIPALRNESAYEELSFIPNLLRTYAPDDYDVTLTCGYPFTNWALRSRSSRGNRPPHVFVTQNGDWPAYAENSEYRWFGCEGLVCTNPDYLERNKDRWRCALIPNGVDVDRFRAAQANRSEFGLPENGTVILMVSALIDSKRVDLGIEAAACVPDAYLVVAGDGPDRARIDELANSLMPGRFKRLTLPPEKMPALYKSADLFMHLSKVESFGNVFVEAMAAGLPVVAPDTTRTRWIVGDEEFLFEDDRPADIARALTQAGTSASSIDRSRNQRIEKFRWTAIAADYRSFLSDVIAANGAGKT